MATLGLSKVFILDKYFTELQKFWETEKKLQGESPASSSFLFHFGVRPEGRAEKTPLHRDYERGPLNRLFFSPLGLLTPRNAE